MTYIVLGKFILISNFSLPPITHDHVAMQFDTYHFYVVKIIFCLVSRVINSTTWTFKVYWGVKICWTAKLVKMITRAPFLTWSLLLEEDFRPPLSKKPKGWTHLWEVKTKKRSKHMYNTYIRKKPFIQTLQKYLIVFYTLCTRRIETFLKWLFFCVTYMLKQHIYVV